MVNIKIIEGKSARKKLKATAEALKVKAPYHKPLKKKTKTSYIDTPSKPGITIFLRKLMNRSMIF